MNRFLIERNPQSIAESLCDQHIVKMPLEEAQMLCTALWHHNSEFAFENNLYKPVHQKHPCTLWCMETRANFKFAFMLYWCMLLEYKVRYRRMHGARKPFHAIMRGMNHIPKGKITKHPQCFGQQYESIKTDEDYPINAYRDFYKLDKLSFARWKHSRKPYWLN